MVSISRQLSAEKVSTYYRSEYSAATSYYSESSSLRGDYTGKLAASFGLEGRQIKAEEFDRLALGQDPRNGDQLIKHRDTIRTREGKELGRRAGWDLTFSAPKSVSLAALPGGDERIVEAHRKAVRAALAEAETLIQARMGGNTPPVTTGKCLFAVFDHDTARPVDDYAAAQLHSHCVLINMTEDARGQARSLQTHELYVAAPMLTAVYQNSLEIELRRLGYQIERGKNHAPEIIGFSREYIASESLRSKEIAEEMKAEGVGGAAAASIAAHSTRDGKKKQSPAEVKAAHLENAVRFGNQPAKVVAEAQQRRARELKPETILENAHKAVAFARVKLSERNSVFDHHEVLTEALRYARGKSTLLAIKAELERQKTDGLFIPVTHVRPNAPLFRYTTPEAIADERFVIEAAVSSQQRSPIRQVSDEELADRHPQLNEWQRRIIRESLGAQEQITGIQGSAGTGKSFSLSVIREVAQESGWQVHGLAPTSRAVHELNAVGVDNSETIARFLMRDEPDNLTSGPLLSSVPPRLLIMDESSLTAARQMRAVIERMRQGDRMLIVGDRRQHGSVEAGRMFEELQLAGMRVARINKLVRQQDEGLKEVVKAFAQGRVPDGVKLLEQQGRITSVQHRGRRFTALAKDYAQQPEGTLVISPDNASRHELNGVIRDELRAAGKLGPDLYAMRTLVNRQDITGADRAVATSYRVGDVVRFRGGSKKIGIEAKTYATVIASDPDKNTVTVQKDNGRAVRYDPEKLRGVSIFEPAVRRFALGERVQFTAPSKALRVANRDQGTITYLDPKGNVRIALDSGRTAGFNLKTNAHVEHGYVSTSHASQGATADRLLLQLDTSDSRIRNLVNKTLAYVALSRPRFDARVYTDNGAELARALLHHKENSTALSREQIEEYKKRGMAA